MRLFPAFLAVSLFLLWSLSISTHAEESVSDNHALNPGFEEWPEQPAEGEAWGALNYSVGVEGRDGAPDGEAFRTGVGETDEERHSGEYAQFIRTHTYGRGAISAGMPVQVDTRLRISVWAKVEAGEFHFNVCFAHDPWSYIGEWEQGPANGQWTQFTKEIVVPEGCEKISVVMFFQNGSGYLDDLEIADLGFAEKR